MAVQEAEVCRSGGDGGFFWPMEGGLLVRGCGSDPGTAVKEAWRLFRKRGSLGCAL